MSKLRVIDGILAVVYMAYVIATMFGYDPTFRFVAISAFLGVSFHFGHLAGWDGDGR